MRHSEESRSLLLALTVFTLIFLICGMGILGFGIYAYVTMESTSYSSLSHINFGVVSSLFVAIGCFVIVVAVLGCCGAWKNKKRLLFVFLIFMVFILLCQLAAVILGFTYKDQVQKTLQKDMYYALIHDYGQPGFEKTVTKGFDYLQKKHECCGVLSYEDWFDNKKSHSVPDSCCQHRPHCGRGHVDHREIWNKGDDGCWKKLNKLVISYLPAIAGLAAGVLLIQLCSVGIAAALLHQLREDQTDRGGRREIRPPEYPTSYKMEPQPMKTPYRMEPQPMKKPPPPPSEDEYDPNKTYL